MQILPKNYNYEDALIVLKEMLQAGCYRLYKLKYVTSLIHIYIGYGDGSGGAKGSKRINETTNLYEILLPNLEKLYNDIVDRNRPIRKIGIDFCSLQDMSQEQYDLFTDIEKVKKKKRLVESILTLQDKYGKNTILKGIDFRENATQIERNKLIGGHSSGED